MLTRICAKLRDNCESGIHTDLGGNEPCRMSASAQAVITGRPWQLVSLRTGSPCQTLRQWSVLALIQNE